MNFSLLDDGESSASVQAFDAIIAGSFQTYLNLSKKIGDDVAKHSLMVEAAFKAQRAYLVVAAKSKKPDDSVLPELLKPTSDKICEIQDFREKNRRSSQFNHLSSISESIPALGWVTVVSNFLHLQKSPRESLCPNPSTLGLLGEIYFWLYNFLHCSRKDVKRSNALFPHFYICT